MVYTYTQQVKDCRDCPALRHHKGQGECWTYCAHHNCPSNLSNSILWGCMSQFDATPDWCPIKNS